MSPLSPLDSFVDPTYGIVTKCPLHHHIRECFLTEMDRAVVKDQVRFQHSMHVLREEVCPRFNFQLIIEDDEGNHPELRLDMHDSRFRRIVEDYVAYRKTIPMTLDEHDLPVLRPPNHHYAALDIMENLRLALDERDRLYRISERSKRHARNAHMLLTSAMAYIRALKDLFDITEGPQRAIFDCGLISAMETERQAVHLATSIIEEHFKDKEFTNDVLFLVTKRMNSYLDVLNAHENALNCDVLTSVAIASNMRLFQASLLWAGYQTTRPLETFGIPVVVEPTAEEKATWTYETVKTEAVRRYIAAQRALDAVKTDMAGMGKNVFIDFDMYPQQNLVTGAVTFVIDQSAYADIQEDLSG
ncbi:hypothetical protein SBRCBS47491_009973 [Sporothrix bragantina]|uniref:Uncharacterized protein n=1 Tax=Sporothrix bragantina TaxID=671064 RepID=A0ABP0CZR8_9PEZI